MSDNKIHTATPAPASIPNDEAQQQAAARSISTSDKTRFAEKMRHDKSAGQSSVAKDKQTDDTRTLFQKATTKHASAKSSPSLSAQGQAAEQKTGTEEGAGKLVPSPSPQRQTVTTAESQKTQGEGQQTIAEQGGKLPLSPHQLAQQQQEQGQTAAKAGTAATLRAEEGAKVPSSKEFAQTLKAQHDDLHKLKSEASDRRDSERMAAVLQNMQSSPTTMQQPATAGTSATQAPAPARDMQQLFQEIQSISQQIMRTDKGLEAGGSFRIQLQSAILPETAVTFSLGAGGVLQASFSSSRKESIDKIKEHRESLKAHVRSQSGVTIEVETTDESSGERSFS